MMSYKSYAQEDSLAKQQNRLTVTGYVETYYSYDFNKPGNNDRPGFFYSHNRHNEFNLNLGFIKAAYSNDRVRATFAVATGTYMSANYSAEPGTLKNIYEANAGVKLSSKKNLWLDAGVLPSHIGFESAIAKDCWTLTRSILAENSPYFETSAKLTYTTDNNKWVLSALALNGWQKIRRLDGNSLMSFGAQVQYKPTETLLLNYSNFVGTDKPDSARTMRYFNNFYAIFNATEKLGVTLGLDLGTQQQFNGSEKMYTWYSPVIIAKYTVNNHWAVTGRGEYYRDKNGVIINTGLPGGFDTAGFSVNVDYSPVSNAVIRLEVRTLNSKNDIFVKDNDLTQRNNFITSSIALSF